MSGQNKPKKSLGQHWLRDQESLDAVVEMAGITSSDTVVEVGPGLGFLTDKLCAAAERVVAVEFDHDLAIDLPKRVSRNNLSVIEADILDFDYASQPSGYKLVGNIPYYLTSHLLRVALEHANKPTVIVFLIQKEVAERLAATPGSMSILAVTAQYYASVTLGPLVPADLFEPPPKVDSQIIALHVRSQPLFDVPVDRFFRLVKAGFGEKRKTLRNSLSGGLALDKAVIEQRLAKAGVSPQARAQELSMDDWYSLYQVFDDTM